MPTLTGAQRPDSIDDTPQEPEYELIMWNAIGTSDQIVELNRDEFVTLKQHLATIRGYPAENENEHGEVERMSTTE